MEDTLGDIKVKTKDGEIKDASIINIVSKDDTEYVIYAVDNGNETSNLYASRIVIDDKGETALIDIDAGEKADIIRYIQDTLSE